MPLSAGSRLGPYEVLGLLGAGGMGAVYRARDPRLGRDVALKVILTEGEPSAERLKRFEDEARAVARLSHPNVLSVFDVGAHDGRPYVVFELLEGETLGQRLRLGPLPLRPAVETAVQACRGLQAAHARGILHRDLKPENLFLTSDGFVKILDFGLAKLTRGDGAEAGPGRTQTVAGIVMGTPGYLSPEQARGGEADARSDLFALGAILYEALSGRRAFSGATAAETISAILHEDPPPVRTASGPLPGPVDRVVRRCLAKEPGDRFHSAHDLAFALEAVLDRPAAAALAGDDGGTTSPYPGLGSFTEADADRFFGREGEVEALWQRIRARRLLAVIGPSGAGKTSFARAGVVASRPSGWAAVVTTPGASPFLMLGQALAPELQGDVEALRRLVRFEDPGEAFETLVRWRKAHAEALLVVDQFEELFTLCAPEAQSRFAALLGRLAGEAGVHVLLSMRDDFLMRCHEQEALAPVFAELTPLGPLTGEALRRALEEPAKAEGFRFEPGLVGKMTAAVEGERGALPLLAFAVSRLWEKRDRDRKLLTQEAYAEIGGVAGALARHAEATLERIGAERQGMVREVFRNLVTAQGTRAACDREELLSVFPDRKSAEEVLGQLVAARLLTSWEMPLAEGSSACETTASAPGRHRIEIVHESLLRSWLRLVRWQAQDAEGSLLRDQLKQAAHLWDEKGRPADLLWSGTSLREYALWRERYPGKLTAVEEGFAKAMTDRALRVRRLRRAAVSAALVGLSAVAIVVSASRQQAVTARKRAEAARLVALGRVELDRYPTAALAYARKSLEIADNAEARRLAVEALWRGPAVRVLPLRYPCYRAAFSPDGQRLAAYTFSEFVQLVDADGSSRLLGGFPQPVGPPTIGFSPRGRALVAGWWEDVPGRGTHLRLREVSVPEGTERRWLEPPGRGERTVGWAPRADGMLVFAESESVLSWDLVPWEGDGRRRLGAARRATDFAASGDRLFLLRERGVGLRPLAGLATTPERLVAGLPPGRPLEIRVSPRGQAIVKLEDASGQLLTLLPDESAPAGRPRLFRIAGPDPQFPPGFDAEGRRLVWGSSAHSAVSVWDLDGPPDAEPLELVRPGDLANKEALFSPRGDWLAVASHGALSFWPQARPTGWTLRRHAEAVNVLRFAPDSASLVSCAADGLGIWPMTSRGGAEGVRHDTGFCEGLAFSPDGGQMAWVTPSGVRLGRDPGRDARWLFRQGELLEMNPWGAAFDTTGQRVAVGASYARSAEDLVLRVFDLAGGTARVIPLVPPGEAFEAYEWGVIGLVFAPDGALLTGGFGGIRRVDVETGCSEWVWRADGPSDLRLDLAPDGRTLLALVSPWEVEGRVAGRLMALDLETRRERAIPSHGLRLSSVAFSPSGHAIVTGDAEGVVRVGPSNGGEPHLLTGHAAPVASVAVSPDGLWIASASGNEIRLWPMPDLSRPPSHTLPYAELMARLDAQTNLRVVEDGAAATGYSLELGPFPGWKEVPTW